MGHRAMYIMVVKASRLVSMTLIYFDIGCFRIWDAHAIFLEAQGLSPILVWYL